MKYIVFVFRIQFDFGGIHTFSPIVISPLLLFVASLGGLISGKAFDIKSLRAKFVVIASKSRDFSSVTM